MNLRGHLPLLLGILLFASGCGVQLFEQLHAPAIDETRGFGGPSTDGGEDPLTAAQQAIAAAEAKLDSLNALGTETPQRIASKLPGPSSRPVKNQVVPTTRVRSGARGETRPPNPTPERRVDLEPDDDPVGTWVPDGRTLDEPSSDAEQDPVGTWETDLPPMTPPYSLDNVIGTFGSCRPGGRQHKGLDLAGLGPNLGLGSRIVSMALSEVVLVGRPEEDPEKLGRLDKRKGETERGRQQVPRSGEVEGYGTVYFFTRSAGEWRTGAILVTRVLDGPYAGHQIRYMHLGAIHPEIQVGDILEPGQEIGVMGGTGVQWSTPHVHIDVQDPDHHRIDVAPLLGLPADETKCSRRKRR